MFFTAAQVYDHNNLFNQILFKALKILKIKGNNNRFHNEICGLLYYFDDIADVPVTESVFADLQFTRNTAIYEKAITLARLIIQNYSPDIKTGMNNLIGLLFDMNMLYEKVVYKLLKRHEIQFQGYQLQLSSQHSKKFWNSRSIRPDIMGEYFSLNDQNRKRFIIDTKWKCPYDGNPADDDLKQMFAYNVHFGVFNSILLYPNCQCEIPKTDSFYDSVSIKQEFKFHSCSTAYIQLFDEDGKINSNAGMELLNSILK
jgi:5-methylcytosine-specific restriction enzyme subunit McrC